MNLLQPSWTKVADKLPPLGKDVLGYHREARGYAVTATRIYAGAVVWINSTTGRELIPAPTDWQDLPPPPELDADSEPSMSLENDDTLSSSSN